MASNVTWTGKLPVSHLPKSPVLRQIHFPADAAGVEGCLEQVVEGPTPGQEKTWPLGRVVKPGQHVIV